MRESPPPRGGRFATVTTDVVEARPTPVRSIALAGSKGGVGTTTIAVELAAMASADGFTVALIDLVPCGDSHYRLDIPIPASRHTVEDLLPLADELDEQTIESAMPRSADGIRLLPSPDRVVDLDGLPRLVRSLSAFFELLVVDAGRLADTVCMAFDACDSSALVLTPDVVGVGDAGRLLDEMEGTAIDRHSLAVLLNRSLRGDDLISVRDVESYLGARVISVLGEESALCRAASDRGHFVHDGRSKLSESLNRLYHSLLFPKRLDR
jgi:Flp pilus assembly CpaE family ATPase